MQTLSPAHDHTGNQSGLGTVLGVWPGSSSSTLQHSALHEAERQPQRHNRSTKHVDAYIPPQHAPLRASKRDIWRLAPWGRDIDHFIVAQLIEVFGLS
jgi:hypothetical protein